MFITSEPIYDLLSLASSVVIGTSLNTIQLFCVVPLNKFAAKSVKLVLSSGKPLVFVPVSYTPNSLAGSTPRLLATNSVLVDDELPNCLSASTVNLYSVVTAG